MATIKKKTTTAVAIGKPAKASAAPASKAADSSKKRATIEPALAKAGINKKVKKDEAEKTVETPNEKGTASKSLKKTVIPEVKATSGKSSQSLVEKPTTEQAAVERQVTKSTKKRTQASEAEKVVINTSVLPDSSRIKMACDALLQHVTAYEQAKKQKTLSLPGVSKDGQQVFLQFGLRGMPEQALKTFKGRPIPLPHPFRNTEECSICLFVKDKPEAKKWLGDDYEKHGIKKIISLQQLRTQYKAYQDLRELADLYDAFVADDRIVCMLPKALGKAFYVGAKKPLPIRLAQHGKLDGDVTKKISKALHSTYFYLSGVSTSLRVGTTNQGSDELVANIEAVMQAAVEFIPGKWKGVQSVFLKSEKSAALPLYEAPLTHDDA